MSNSETRTPEVSVTETDILTGTNFRYNGKTYRAHLQLPKAGYFYACEVPGGGKMVGEDILFKMTEDKNDGR